MGGVSLNQPLINDESLPLPLPGSIAKQGDRIEGLLSAGWTNERHSSYISSMEASFVEQFYGQDKCNYDANKNNLHNITINSFPENPWVRRFKPRGACVNHRGTGMEPIADDYGSGTDTGREKVRNHEELSRLLLLLVKAKKSRIRIFLTRGCNPLMIHARNRSLLASINDPLTLIFLWLLSHTETTKASESHAFLKPEGDHGRPVMKSSFSTM